MDRDTYRNIVARMKDDTDYFSRRDAIEWNYMDAICVDRIHSAPIKEWVQTNLFPCFVNDFGNAGYDFFEFPDEKSAAMFTLVWR